ncbi:MAG: hypothetical protein IKA65_07200, partial [Lentisphaeria bacterium]|nr:hypothetical protein [Lentisphaeria bacterium]
TEKLLAAMKNNKLPKSILTAITPFRVSLHGSYLNPRQKGFSGQNITSHNPCYVKWNIVRQGGC